MVVERFLSPAMGDGPNGPAVRWLVAARMI
jgi:hypothetical protein